MKYTARQPSAEVNVTPTSPIKEFFILLGGLLAIILVVYVLLGVAVNLIVPRISTEFEKKIAAPFINSFETIKEDSEQVLYVQSVVDRMQKNCAKLPYEFNVHIMESQLANAIALPGGHIIILTGLLDKISSENELAYILGHEMGHYANRDHLRALGRGLVLMGISVMLFGTDSNVSDLMGSGLGLTELSFSRAQETQADEYGLEVLNCTYGHVAGCTAFFHKMAKEDDPGIFGHYFSTHPENKNRMAHVRQIIRARGMKKLYLDQIPEFLKEFETESAIKETKQ